MRIEDRRIGDVAAELGITPWDLVCDTAIADELMTSFRPEPGDDTPEDWAARIGTWSDPRVVLGGSDAGAHLTTLATWDWATELLSLNRARQALPLEKAVRRVTGDQADLYGIVDRGYLREGSFADLVVFDPETIAPGPVRTVNELPGGSDRLTSGAEGISHVVVNGTTVVHNGSLTGEAAGRVFRSGRDTRTVPLT
jgi:N-acyl-D-aspartate/D-glutamate deacylase